MKTTANKEISKKASKCPRDHDCLSVGGSPCCEISDAVNDTVFFTKYRHPLNCPYQHAFGSAQMCSCPVRLELFRQREEG